MTTPIFVVGLNRSGTKWLSNELAKHPQIACVQNERTGIRETNMFRGFGRKFDLNNIDEYIALVELWAASDFFHRTGVDKSIFYLTHPLPNDTLTMFGILMDEYARLQGKPYWLQKAQPIAGLELARHFPKAHFVIIRRQLQDQVRSVCKLKDNRLIWNVARATFANVRENKMLDRLQSLAKCPVVQYERFMSHRDEELTHLFQQWGMSRLDSDSKKQTDKIPNTSFNDPSQKGSYFQFPERMMLHLTSMIAGCIPYSFMLHVAQRSWQKAGPIVPGSFANIEAQYPRLRESFGPSRRRIPTQSRFSTQQAQLP